MGGSAPDADPNIGLAALSSARTGREALRFMRQQARTTNQWARQDRNRYRNTFIPMQNRYIREANGWDSAERQGQRAQQASADVMIASDQAADQRERSAMAMGVDPRSGRYRAAEGRASMDTALASAGAKNMSRRAVEQEGMAMRANAINMGSGMAVNPGTSMGLSNGAAQAGFGAAQQGYGQQGDLLNTQYQQQMAAWQANQGGLGGLLGGLGSIAGLAFGSSKEIKTDKADFDALGAVRDMPVEEWTYKPGEGDEGRHVGPYAEDFAAATGLGDGKSIDVISAVGVTMGAVRQLDQKVSKMLAKIEGLGAVEMREAA